MDADRTGILQGFLPFVEQDLDAWMRGTSDSTVAATVLGGTMQAIRDSDASHDEAIQYGYVAMILVTRDPEDVPGATAIVNQLLETLRELETAQQCECSPSDSTED